MYGVPAKFLAWGEGGWGKRGSNGGRDVVCVVCVCVLLLYYCYTTLLYYTVVESTDPYSRRDRIVTVGMHGAPPQA